MAEPIVPPIPFLDLGGSGLPLHFSHANGYPPACYFPMLEGLCKGYHVISMLQRPLWKNTNPGEIKDWSPFTDDLLSFLDQESLPPLVAIGHSMGGNISLRAALIDPERFKALVLIDPVLFHPIQILLRRLIISNELVYRLHPLIRAARFRRQEFTNLETIFTGYRRKSIFRYLDDTNLRIYIHGITLPETGGGYRLFFSPEWEMRIYATGIWHDMDLWRRMKDLKVPILIIRGAETDTFMDPAARLFLKRLPSTKIVTMENSTHLVPLEHPIEVANIILRFLQEKL
jgi:pimeloyl-ACP methyl ester carboxylesterase